MVDAEPDPAGVPEHHHQRRTGDARRRATRRAARCGSARGRDARNVCVSFADTGPGMSDETRAPDLRSVLHDEGGRRGHRPRTDDQLRHHRRARRPHLGGEHGRPRHDVLHRTADRRSGVAPAPTREVAPDAAASAPLERRRILVVDDEESIQKLLTGVLEMDGHEVHSRQRPRGAGPRRSASRST